jgi:hypothetical protein
VTSPAAPATKNTSRAGAPGSRSGHVQHGLAAEGTGSDTGSLREWIRSGGMV